MFRIHDVMTGFDGLYLSGLKYYSDRALILPGMAIVYDGELDYHIDYLRDVGIGPADIRNDIIRIKDDEIVRGIASNPDGISQVLKGYVAAGGRIQFFSTTPHEHALLESLRIPWDAAYNPPADLATEANSKSELRRLGMKLGLKGNFPDFRIIPCLEQSVIDAIADIRSRPGDFVVLKRPDLASGDGMILVPRSGETSKWVEKYVDKHHSREIIVEAGWRHVPMSVQWEVEDDGVHFACASVQLIDDTFEHKGNIIASRDIPRVSPEDIVRMKQISFPVVENYRLRGYRGVCGFDFMKTDHDGSMYMLECNGRITATTYAYGVARQLVDTERLRDWAIVFRKVEIKTNNVRTVRGVHQRLGRRLFDGTTGALPFNVRLLDADYPQFAVCCIGHDAEEATVILRDVKRRFGH